MVRKISPFLWFDSSAEDAAEFYVSLFPDSRIEKVVRYGAAGPLPAGTVMTVDFVLAGQRFTALNGGPVFKFSPAVSFMVSCADQEEVDRYWNAFSKEGTPSQCGWIDDKFGVTWQIVPAALIEMMESDDAKKVERMTEAMMKMGKLVIADLRAAFAGG